MNDIIDHILMAPINHENTAENVLKNAYYAHAHKEIPLLISNLVTGFWAKADAKRADVSVSQ